MLMTLALCTRWPAARIRDWSGQDHPTPVRGTRRDRTPALVGAVLIVLVIIAVRFAVMAPSTPAPSTPAHSVPALEISTFCGVAAHIRTMPGGQTACPGRTRH